MHIQRYVVRVRGYFFQNKTNDGGLETDGGRAYRYHIGPNVFVFQEIIVSRVDLFEVGQFS